MTRYFFHLHDELDCADEEGFELADWAEVQTLARECALEMAAESIRAGRLNLAHNVEVIDEAGHHVLTVAFGDVVTIEPAPALA